MGRRAGQYLLITIAVGIATTTALVPGAVTPPTRRAVSAVPQISVPVRMKAPTADAAVARSSPTTIKTTPRAVKRSSTTARRPSAHQPATVAAKLPARPGDLVREVHVMYARDSRSGDDPPNSSPCPRATTCRSYQLRPPRWPTDETGRAVIPYAYSDEGRRRARAPDGLMEPALRASLAQWTHWNSNIVFQSTGTSAATFGAAGDDGSCDDGTNVVTWDRMPSDVIGQAVVCYDRSGKVIRDADLALNAVQHWERIYGEPESRHSYDIESILTHELGHWLGLEDLYSAEGSRQTMAGSTEYSETRKRTPALGDVVGLQTAYPCAGADACPRSGIADD